jgi:hypothetical protein
VKTVDLVGFQFLEARDGVVGVGKQVPVSVRITSDGDYPVADLSLLQKSGRAWVLSPPSRFKRVAAFG